MKKVFVRIALTKAMSAFYAVVLNSDQPEVERMVGRGKTGEAALADLKSDAEKAGFELEQVMVH
jgi:hypothetical protein